MSTQKNPDGRFYQMPHRIENEKKAPIFRFPENPSSRNNNK